jgi:L-alanine-DL-glutamate epimerase-like enolase superfamily enzyme
MKINRITVYHLAYSLAQGTFSMSGGKTASGQESTIVRIETDSGLIGWGETCPFSPMYMPAFAGGARAAIHEFGPALLGCDPRQFDVLEMTMDRMLPGHLYAKMAIDMACWDILGLETGMSVSELLGGRFSEQLSVYTGVSIGEPEMMRDQAEQVRDLGYRSIQLKVGEGFEVDINRIDACLDVLPNMHTVIVDANGGWNRHDAARVLSQYSEADILIEQPCPTIESCAILRGRSRLPFVLDESLDSFSALVRANSLGAMDAANLKLSRFGGMTRVRRMRDICSEWAVAVTIEDSGGGDIVSAAMTHMSASTRPGLMLSSYLASDMVNEQIAEGAPRVVNGTVRVPTGPGLGISVDEAALGEPAFELRA